MKKYYDILSDRRTGLVKVKHVPDWKGGDYQGSDDLSYMLAEALVIKERYACHVSITQSQWLGLVREKQKLSQGRLVVQCLLQGVGLSL